MRQSGYMVTIKVFVPAPKDELAIWWAETSQLRLDLEIPADRLAKMEKAVQKAIGG